MPPHLGHQLMCETGAALAECMTVLVCSTELEPLAGDLRAQWMRELLPQCRVQHMHRDIPQEPAEHADFWNIWRVAIREYHPQPIDLVLGSEPYVFRLAAELDARAVLLDPERELTPVSGSSVRADPLGAWQWLPQPVRKFYQRRVCILGPESTGKSTLTTELARRFDGTPMTEYGRTYDAFYRRGEDWQHDDFIHLATTHLAMRESLSERGRSLVVEDTDAIQTAVWAAALKSEVSLVNLVPRFEPADLYLLLTPEVAWHDDNTRYFGDPSTRAAFFDSCKALLEAHACRYLVVSGSDWSARTEQAASAVAVLLASVARSKR